MRERRGALWWAWMVAGGLACALYPVLSPATVPAAVLYSTIGFVSVAVTFAAVRYHRPDNAGAWYLFAAGQLTWAAGDVAYAVGELVLDQPPHPSWADALHLSAYPLLVTGLIRLARGRRSRDLAALIDAAISATGLGLVYWVFVIDPILADGTLPLLTRTITIAYPTAGVLLFAIVSQLLTSTGRKTPSRWLLIAGGALMLASGVLYSLIAALPVDIGGLIGTGFMFSYVCWAGAALHPSMRAVNAQPPARRGFGKGRLATLALATLLAPAVLFVQGMRHGTVDWLAIGIGAVVLFLLVLIRMSGFVTQVQAQSRQLEDLAMRDELTGLANRRRFEQRLADAVATGAPQVAILDLTGFKNVNDRFGHAVGDRLLAAVAERLAGRLRDSDLVARMGGDEFAVLVPEATLAEGDAIAERLVAALRKPVEAAGFEFLAGAAIGVADATGTDDPSEVLRRADIAMYAAKDSGERARRYAPELDDRATEEARLGAEIRTALDTGQFHVVYQPIVALPEGHTVSVEALVRWHHPARGPISPAEFIPVAEHNGLIVELGAWILHTACAKAVTWRSEHGDAAPRVSVNVSARQLAEPGFADLVAETLASTSLAADCLVVEVTETAVFGGGHAVQAVNDLHRLGVRIALDDFGTGHSSLGLLQTVPVDVLKVDKTFVDDITLAGRQAVIATALIQVANGLGLTAVAEGVETAEQAEELYRLGYRLAQGYHFGKPVPQPDFTAGLRVLS